MGQQYKKAVELLTSKEKFYISLGLERIEKLLAEFDNPQNKLRIIHTAGTNGKGSFCAIISEILKNENLKVGLFTSPHITSYKERIKINGKEISEQNFFSILQEIDRVSKKKEIYLTEFEILTAAAFIYFERKKVDFAVMEVGLGGRLDATNAVKKPFLTVITSISHDHTERLGKTINEIAYEKAGIIKKGVECIVSAQNKGIDTIRKIAQEKHSQLVLAHNIADTLFENNTNYAVIQGEKYKFALLGNYQSENLSLILTAIWVLRQKGIFISDKAFTNGLKRVRHAARFEYYKSRQLIIDGAHNPDGARALRESLDKYFPKQPAAFIYASINTKDYTSILKNLVRQNDKLVLYDFKRENSVKLKALKEYSQSEIISDVSEIIKLTAENTKQKRLTVITGSLYAIGEIYAALTSELKI